MTAADLKAKYPILADESDSRIDLFIADANLALDPEVYGIHFLRALELWVLCRMVNLTPALRAKAAENESISAQGRSLSVTYSKGDSLSKGIHATNPYCMELEDLTNICCAGGFVA